MTVTSQVSSQRSQLRDVETYMDILEIHLPIPQTGELIKDFTRLLVLNCSTDSVVRAGEVALGLKFYIGD